MWPDVEISGVSYHMRRPRRGVFAAALLIVTAACQDSATEPDQAQAVGISAPALEVVANSWRSRANMPSDRYDPAVAVVTNAQGQTVLYAIAGRTTTAKTVPVGKVQAYNSATNTWTTRASLPQALSATNGAGVINGKIYLSGGQRYDRSIVASLFVYDPATNQWSRKKNLPARGFGGVTGVYQNRLYVVTSCDNVPGCAGGVGSGMGMFRYDPAADAWTFLSLVPHKHPFGMGGFLGGKFYITGDILSPSRVLDVYDPATNSWTTRAPMPTGRSSAAFAAMGGKLYIAGGSEEDLQHSGWFFLSRSVLRYDPTSNQWTSLTPLPRDLPGLAGGRAVVNGEARFEVVGGVRPGNNLQYVP
jgi:N-acetylneuraminic acid mutarotase